MADDARTAEQPTASAPARPNGRRWLLRALLAAGLGLGLFACCVGGAAAVLRLADSGDPVTEVPARGLTRTPAETATPWRMPLLDRTGTTLTVWLPPANKCHRTVPRAPEVIESTHSVVVRANVQLRPVAGTELAWDFGYNQAGADLHILVIRRRDGGTPPTTLATETVNGHEAAIYTRAGGLEYVARWQAGELEFTVEVTPPEGGSTDLAAFRQLLRQLSWD